MTKPLDDLTQRTSRDQTGYNAFDTDRNELDLEILDGKHHQISRVRLERRDVVALIASIWAGLGQTKYPYKIMFSNLLQYSWGSTPPYDTGRPRDGKWLTPTVSDAAIIPLLVKGRIKIVACEQMFHDSPRLRVIVLDGQVKGVDETSILLQALRGFLSSSVPRWKLPCGNAAMNPSPPNEDDIERDWPCPEADSLPHENIHLVLNVWAYMLDIPVSPLGKELAARTYEYAYDLFDFALQGRLRFTDIEEFLLHSGYANSDEDRLEYQCIGDTKQR